MNFNFVLEPFHKNQIFLYIKMNPNMLILCEKCNIYHISELFNRECRWTRLWIEYTKSFPPDTYNKIAKIKYVPLA